MAASSDEKRWVGFDLGGTKMLATVFDGDYKKLGSERKKTKANEGQDAGLERIVKTIQSALDDADVKAEALGGIGIGSPGPLDLDTGTILNTPNLGWVDVPLKKHLEKAFGCPVVVANDVDAGVYGEYIAGAAQGARCVLGVFPGTGIGGGCVYEGQIIRGAKQSCMEIGHIPAVREGPICGCGRRGCLEAVASRLAIAQQAAAAAFRGDAPNLLAACGTDLANIRSGALAASVAAGDEAVERIIKEAAGHIGRAVAGAINLLAPDVVLLGGGLVEAMPELFCEGVEKRARKRVMPSFEKIFEVKVAELGDDATVVGAAAWARARIAAAGTA